MDELRTTQEAPFSELAPLTPLSGVAPAPLRGPWSARAWALLVDALPVLMMAALAAASWWLVKNSPVPPDPGSAAALRHEPDYTMRNFAVTVYGPDGSLRSRLEGDRLTHYPDTDTIEVEGVRLRALDGLGRVTLGSARKAHSNGDGTELRLMGGARVVREPAVGEAPGARVEIRGEFLEVSTQANRVRSHLPVTVSTQQGDVNAGNLDYNHAERSGRFGGRVSGQLRP